MLLNSKIIGEGPDTLIILHGFLGMSDNWKSYAKKIASFGFEIHLVDQRNHGDSFQSDEFNYNLLANDLKYYIDYNKLNNISLIGHSMGGKTAMMFSSLFPLKLINLIIVDILPIHYNSNFRIILNSLKSIDLNILNSRKEADTILSQTIKEPSLRGFLLKNLVRNNNKFRFKFNLNILKSKFHEVESSLNLDSPFNGKTLFIKGENSNYVQEKEMKISQNYFPNLILKIVPDSGHWVHAENPDIFLEETLAFLKS